MLDTRSALIAVLLVTLLCASTGVAGAEQIILTGFGTEKDLLLKKPPEFDTMMPGWQSKYALDWKMQTRPDGSTLLYGRVTSKYGQFAGSFRLLVTSLDTSGKVIGQRITEIPGGVPGFTSVYFEVGPLGPAASYRVTVWDYTTIEDRDGKGV
ncbi:MAG TPA: hypothetical protein VMI34_14765 [Candidatus Bathyarchaeia archaeon]|nr:hypothetical protein [Candidatus Bathyarchaeia archaeon]